MLITLTLRNCFIILLGLMVTPQHETYQSGLQPATPQQALSRGKFYYDSNDTSDAAVREFRQVIARYPKTEEAETAQYYIGNYYHRKYYINKKKTGNEREDFLDQARIEYKKYINQYSNSGSGKWLSDAHFNLALVHLQIGDNSRAGDELWSIVSKDSEKDPLVYIYQVIWSADPKTVIDYDLNAKTLAELSRTLVKMPTTISFDMFTLRIRRWAQSERSK